MNWAWKYVQFLKESSKRLRSNGGRLWRCWQICKTHYQITWEDAIRAHDEALIDGGAPGVLNEHAIRSALARPYNGYFETLHDKASALIHGVVSNHGFVDGNKRTALYLALLFIHKSGFEVLVKPEAVVDVITAVARREMSREELAEWIREELILPRDQ
ncbi:MAG: type II toxin-antitoxin system death-on-curing family toxin [Rhodothermaceae bacterium]|nr:type II toxin-antitoxin system death-on-curing family toxin [Rhodothermaceae bacterium]MYG68731.1 type II toxin-antitoxin system death-on-curing family toxin [Rhodothermaceae bacterium]MYJ45834.1 type II toxin-antitoxin system death-on-curing family toxin [Rhodothermaceae bacterium]